MISRTSLKISHVWSKTRSPSQILEKSCARSRSHIFGPVLLKVGHNACFGDICNEFLNGSCRVKKGTYPNGKMYLMLGQFNMNLTHSHIMRHLLTPWKTSLLKTLWVKEKLLVMSNFSFSHSVFYLFG